MRSYSPRFVLLDRRTLIAGLVLIFSLAFAAPALAEYLGPDRVTSVFKEVHVPEKDVWTLTHVDPDDDLPDVCLIIHTCAEHPSEKRQNALCGWTADNSGCTEWWEEQEVTIVLPEATISADLQNCGMVDGWCTNSPTLQLTGSEPVDGETITLIEGTRNGESFACTGDSCEVPLLEGQNDFSFWAHSSWGDTSQMGSLSAKVDSEGPFVGIPDSWYIWEPLSIGVADERGIQQVKLSIHGGAYGSRKYSWNLANLPGGFIWDRYFGDIVAPIGEYPVTVTAIDGLGNSSKEYGTIIIPAPDDTDTDALVIMIEGDEAAPADDQSDAVSSDSFGGSDEDADSEQQGASPGAGDADPEPLTSEDGPSETLAGDSNEDSVAAASATTADAQPDASVSPPSDDGGGVLWGAAAAAAIAAATAYGLNRRRQREAAIEAKRKEIAERRSEDTFANHLRNLRSAAEARIAPIRNAMIVAAAAAAEAARQSRARSKARLQTMESSDRSEIALSRQDRVEPIVSRQPDSEGAGQPGSQDRSIPLVRLTGLTEADPSPTPTPTPPYPTPTPSSTESSDPATPPPTETPQPTPSATLPPTETTTPSATPTEVPIYPTNPPGTPIVDFEKLPGQIGDVAEEFVDSFSLVPDEPNPIHPYDWLSPFETFPPTAPFVPYVRGALTFIATFIDLMRPLKDLDPTYPLPEPVPGGPQGSAEGENEVS